MKLSTLGVMIAALPMLAACPPAMTQLSAGAVVEAASHRCAEDALEATEGVKILSGHERYEGAITKRFVAFDAPEMKDMHFGSTRIGQETRLEVSVGFSKRGENSITAEEAGAVIGAVTRIERTIEATCKVALDFAWSCDNAACSQPEPIKAASNP